MMFWNRIKVGLAIIIMLVTSGCYVNIEKTETEYDMEEMRSHIDLLNRRMKALEELCLQLEENIKALKVILEAAKTNDYIINVESVVKDGVEIGYNINFLKSGTVTIYNGKDGEPGINGQPPVVGIKLDVDGYYYWTINGEWLLDGDSCKIKPVGEDAASPQLKVEEDRWLLSYDGGNTWSDYGSSVGQAGENGKQMFKSVELDGTGLILTLANGECFTVPIRPETDIVFNVDTEATVALPGMDVRIDYTLKNPTESTFVTASSDGAYKVIVESSDPTHGTIVVTCPDNYVEGHVNVVVTDGATWSFVRVIRFYEGKVEFPSGLEYKVLAEGGVITIPYSLNFDYSVSIVTGEDWMSAKSGDGLVVTVMENTTLSSRQGKINIYSTLNPLFPVSSVTINQSSLYFDLDRADVSFGNEGGNAEINIFSTKGLVVKNKGEDAEWISASVSTVITNKYKVTLTAARNSIPSRRIATLLCYSSDETTLLGEIFVLQENAEYYTPEEMVFLIHANVPNNYTAYLPLYGDVDCTVDWGDGVVEHFKGGYWQEAGKICHTYEIKEIEEYVVRVKGTVSRLYSADISAPCVVEVRQWGLTGLEYMVQAFYGDYLLRRIAPDNAGSFKGVKSFCWAFSNCRFLEEIPNSLFEYGKEVTDFSAVFINCSSLTSIPSDLFAHCSKTVTFSSAFQDCVCLTSIPEYLFSSSPLVTNYQCVFANCKSLVSIPEGLFSNNPLVTNFYGVFNNCQSLTSIPAGLFSNNTLVLDFTFAFSSCTLLEYIPVELFSNCLRVEYFRHAFEYCRSVKGESPYSIVNGEKVHLYERELYADYFVRPEGERCFNECYQLTDRDNIKSEWRSIAP